MDWLFFPPEDLQIDFIVGHGVNLGKQAKIIKRSKKCQWVQVVHTNLLEELGVSMNYPNPISKGQENKETELELCEMADLVVGVGPKLSEALRRYLRVLQKDKSVADLTPGVFEEFFSVIQYIEERKQRSVFMFGPGPDALKVLTSLEKRSLH